MKIPSTKKELALLYSSDCSMNVALNRLARWINGDPELLNSLHAAGYRDTQRVLSPKQVKIIFDFLGTPDEFHDFFSSN